VIKSYLKNVTQAIRNEGANNIVILGTPYYCQHVGVAASDPIKDNSGNPFKNVAYAFHFYSPAMAQCLLYRAGWWRDGINISGTGLGRVPVFVQRMGYYSFKWRTAKRRQTHIDATNTNWWFNNYINAKYKLSWCNWSVSSHERSSCFSGGTNPSESGQIVMNLLKAQSVDEYEPEWKAGLEGPGKDATFNMPATIPAKQYNRYYGNVQHTKVSFLERDQADPRSTNDSCLKVNTSGDENWVSYKVKLSRDYRQNCYQNFSKIRRRQGRGLCG
jgi:hypothetical protein